MSFKTYRLFLACLMLACQYQANAQQPRADLEHSFWKASWITAQGASPTGYGIYIFRKTIQLAQNPKRFEINISADNRYKLYVNGRFVSAGPARGDIAHYNYDTIDLSPYLTAGKNIVAAQVWNEGEFRPEAQISLRTGFIVQGIGDEAQVINTNVSWKAVRDSSYKPLPVQFPRGMYYVAGPGEFVDMRRHVNNWMSNSLTDSLWQPAQAVGPGIPKYITFAFAPTASWMLVRSTLPQMEYTVQRLNFLKKAVGATPPSSFPESRAPFTIPAHSSATLLLDQGFLTNAYPTLVFSGGRDGGISVSYAEALFSTFPAKGNRNETDNKQFIGRKDSIISNGSKEQTFNSLLWRTYRYVQIQVNTKDEPLTMEDFYGTFTGYPFKQNAKITSDLPELNQILNIGWRTARLCAFETYMDCPYYEQLQYIGDGRIQAMISLYNSGDDRLVKNAINQIDASRTPEGLTESRHPSFTPQYINTFSLWYIGMLHDYMMYGADMKFVKDKLPGTRQVINFFRGLQGNDGSLKNAPYWSFTDWSSGSGWQFGVAPAGKDGSSAAMDLQLLMALQSAADLESKEGSEAYAAEYRTIVARLTKTIRSKYWDSKKGLYADRPEKDVFSQHVNAMAILTGLIQGPDALTVSKKLLEDSSLSPASIYFKYYLHMALTKAGLGNNYLQWLDKWRENMAMGMSTWAETSDINTSRSDCHAWGASPNIEFFRTVLGIDSDAPGFSSLKIEPHLGELSNISGEMPHPKGKIVVNYRNANGHSSAELNLPATVTGRFIWKGKSYALKPGKNVVSL